MSHVLNTVAVTFGWTSFAAWSLACYPTVISNIRLKSVQGITIDYMFFNTSGFFLYTLYTWNLGFNSVVRHEFFDRFEKYPLVKLNDLFFGIHALFLNLLLISQAYFWGFKKNDYQVVSLTCKFGLSLVVLYMVVFSLIITKMDGGSLGLQWLDLFTSLGLIKVGMSVCKNLPQIMYNYNRKSTHGWPIMMIWLDFTGALMSLFQLCIDAQLAGNLMSIFNNPPKLFLCFEVAFADLIFFAQHYFLYFENDAGTKEHTQHGRLNLVGSYGASIDEEQHFIEEHAPDHDGHSVNHCQPDRSDKGELERFLGE